MPRPATEKVSKKILIHIAPGPVLEARTAVEPVDCFKLFFTEEIMEEIIVHTNEEIGEDKKELNGLLGLLILASALKDNHLKAEYLFDVTFSGLVLLFLRFMDVIVWVRLVGNRT